jgi:anthranilate synthase component 2/para-aminobenzoate synthetase component 2
MSARVLLIDNYDSFTWNLAQAFAAMGASVDVRRNDTIGPREARELAPTHLVISPGPGRPEAAGQTLAILEAMIDRVPILGVCLGHQALAVVFGARVVACDRLVHGQASPVYHDGHTLYAGLENPFAAGRYHSLAVDDATLPSELSVPAFTSHGEVMGLRHSRLPVEGVQFHPESVLTPCGERLLANFLEGDAS